MSELSGPGAAACGDFFTCQWLTFINHPLIYSHSQPYLISMLASNPSSISMATLASVFNRQTALDSWTKLEDDDPLSELQAKYWGQKIEDEAKGWHMSHPAVEVDEDNDIGPDCFVLNLGPNLKHSKLWVRKDYIRIYDYCSKRYNEGPNSIVDRARSVVITGHPGVGVFLSSVPCHSLSDNAPYEKVKHIGFFTPPAAVSANRSHFFGIKFPSATYLSRMECLNNMPRASLPATSFHSYGHSLMQIQAQLVFPRYLPIITQTSILCL